jgi:hypothetical protein
MDVIDKFLNHAGECRRMGRFTRDLETRAVWNRMADRWLILAENEKTRSRQLSESRARRAQAAYRSRAA